jgi:polar amino acid transport system permease protein
MLNTLPKAVRWLILLVALMTVLSLLYGIQYYAGGPLQLAVVSEVHDLALSPDGALVAGATEDGDVYLWDIQADWALRKLSGHDGAVVRVAFAGATLFSASRDGTVRLWDVPGGQVEKVLQAPGNKPLSDASLSADASTLATVSADGVVRVWDVATGQEIQSIGPQENTKNAVALSPDGDLVAADDGNDVQIWDARTGEALQKLEGYWADETKEDWMGHEKAVTALAFSPDGELLVSGSADKTLTFWDLENGQDKDWGGEGHFAAITKLVFNPEGGSVMSGCADKKAKIWRVPGGKATSTFVGHLEAVQAVAFGPDAETVFTGGDDGTVQTWNVVNTRSTHTEWTQKGLLPLWGKLFGLWMLVSGVLGLVCLWGLYRLRGWGHPLTLALYIVGPLVVLGLPLLEVTFYTFSWGTRLQIVWPLLALAVGYVVLVWVALQESVATPYEASKSMPLAEQLMSTLRARRLRKSLFIGAVWILLLVVLYSLLRRFDLDNSFMSHFFSFIMNGSWLTLRVSALSIILAIILALLGALGRLSNNPISNGVSGFYISLIRGTPLLVQIYIWYLGLPRLNLILSPLVAGTLALGVNYGAYMTEIFRAGIQAISKGQHEAAQALGMSRPQTLRRIVLPQAFRIVIPPIGNEFIAMMKDSSLVSIMGVWELTFRAGKIGRQYFRSMETFIIAAAFYWLLTVVFQFLQGKLEDHMARGERR